MSYSLRDYLEIGEEEAVRQWRAILARRPVVRGDRQVVVAWRRPTAGTLYGPGRRRLLAVG